ncbi:MAG: hypothetical protein FD153_997 [Rhodospirillaceae bacterium]|nr:MAG: hypothetical protein FD153_997 [Rhodospirillaceae bacterium]
MTQFLIGRLQGGGVFGDQTFQHFIGVGQQILRFLALRDVKA